MENNNEVHNHDYDHDHEDERSGIRGLRWNPTKEQIEMLEKIYSNDGVRTPSAEQVQQITTRLRVYGHIEGKNVFYWFQNHKARQRRNQRHERLLAAANCPPPHHHYLTNPSINGLNLNARPPILSAPHPNYHYYPYLPTPNVICGPYYHLPQSNPRFYNHSHHNYNTPATVSDDVHQEVKRSSKPTKSKLIGNQNTPCGGDRIGVPLPHGSTLSGYYAAMMNSKLANQQDHNVGNSMGMRTLDLFPVHPTGVLEHKLGGTTRTNNVAASYCATSWSSDTNMNDNYENHQHPQLIDFFSIGHA